MNTIGDRIKTKRKELGLTQIELGAKLHVTDRAVSKWEQNDGNPDFLLLPKLAEILGVTLDYLITGKVVEPVINLDDMDEKKRLSYLIKKDDIDSFVKYAYQKSAYIFGKKTPGIKTISLNVDVWKEIINAKANRIFTLCCDEYFQNDIPKENQIYGMDFFSIPLIPFINEFVKMVVDIDKPAYLQAIGLKFYDIGNHSQLHSRYLPRNNNDYFRNFSDKMAGRNEDKYYVGLDTLEYFFINADKSQKCFSYITYPEFKLDFKYNYKNESKYVFTYLENAILHFAVKYEKYDVINHFLKVYEEELSKIQDGFEFHNLHNSYFYRDQYSVIDGRVLAFERNLIESLLLKSRIDDAKKLADYNKTVQEKINSLKKIHPKQITVPQMTETEMERFVLLNSNSTSEEEKEKIRCIDNGILIVGKAKRLKNLKLLREILDESIYNPFEKVCKYYLSSDYKQLFKYYIDLGLGQYADKLLSDDKAKFAVLIKESFNWFASQQNPLDVKVMEKFGDEAVQIDFGIKDMQNPEDEDKFNIGVSKYCLEKMYAHILESKEEVYIKIKQALDEEKAQAQLAQERIESKKGLTKEYFRELLSSGKAKDKKIFILDLCSLFDAILKYDYKCEGEDFFGRMNSYYQAHAPRSRDCDDGWGYMVPDTKFEDEIVKPWQHTWSLLSRLRIMRNNIAHSEHNKVEELSQAELEKCLEFIFTINIEEE